MLSKVNDVGQIFALKVGRDRDRPETYDFEVLADVAVEYEKMKHVGLGPNIVECFGLVTNGPDKHWCCRARTPAFRTDSPTRTG